MTRLQLLKRWLTTKEYGRYMRAARDQGISNDYLDTMVTNTNYRDVFFMVIDMISWYNTKEGQAYWEAICNRRHPRGVYEK